MNFFERIALKFGLAGVLVLLSSPVLFFMMRPLDDVAFHFFRTKPDTITSRDSLAHNQFVSVEGEIDPDSIFVSSRGVVSRKHGYFFQLKDAQPTCFFYCGKGELHEKLKQQTERSGELFLAGLDDAVFQTMRLEGRVHQSNRTSIIEFGTAEDSSDIGFEDYLKNRFAANAYKQYFMVVIGELPGNFSDSNGALFVFAFGMAAAFLAWFIFRIRKRRAANRLHL